MAKSIVSKTRWFKLSFDEQMANVGAEIGRTINWRNKDQYYSRMAFKRAMILLDLTIQCNKNRLMLGKLQNRKKSLIHWFKDKPDPLADKQWEDYFYAFNYAARLKTIHD